MVCALALLFVVLAPLVCVQFRGGVSCAPGVWPAGVRRVARRESEKGSTSILLLSDMHYAILQGLESYHAPCSS